MKFVIQRVNHANVKVDGDIIGQIDKGFLVFIGVSHTDTTEIADKMVKKLVGLRIFDDSEGKTNLDLKTVDGSLLLISQFTLYADCRKGRRPSFTGAGSPEHAKNLYEYVVEQCTSQVKKVAHGEFGAEMIVEIINDGPFTIVLDSADLA